MLTFLALGLFVGLPLLAIAAELARLADRRSTPRDENFWDDADWWKR